MKTHTDLSGLLAEIDALDLAPGSRAATDADGTLWGADLADVAWQRVLHEKLMRTAGCDAIQALAAANGLQPTDDPYHDAQAIYDLYMDGVIGDGPLIEAMVVCYAGWSEDEVRSYGETVYRQEIATRVYETTLPLIEALAAREIELTVVSGSARLLVEACVGAMGFSVRVCGASSRAVEGVVGPEMIHPITWNHGKVEALKIALDGAPVAVAFGDTAGDWELLESAVAMGVLVHPRPGLRRRAQECSDAGRGRWAILAPPKTVGGHTVKVPESDQPLAQA